MNSEFTAEAKVLWDAIPLQIQKQLINNVWCLHCFGMTTITDFRGRVRGRGYDFEWKLCKMRGKRRKSYRK